MRNKDKHKQSSSSLFRCKFFTVLLYFFFFAPIVGFNQIAVPDSIDKAKQLVQEGKRDEGLALLHQLQLLTKEDSLQQAEIWHNLAVIHYRASILDSAVYHASNALVYRQAQEESAVNTARTLFVKAAANREWSRLFAAVRDLEQAIALLEANKEEPGAMRRLPNMYLEAARLNERLGNFDLSLLFAEKAKTLYQAQEAFNLSRQIAVLEIEGAALDSQEKLTKAEQNYREALQLAAIFEEPTSLKASSQNNLGLVLTKKGQLLEADSLHRAAKATYLACYANDPLPYYQQALGAVQANLAKLSNQRGQFNQTVNLVAEGLAFANVGFGASKHPEKAELLATKGIALLELGAFDESLQNFQLALNNLLLDDSTPLSVQNLENRVILDRSRLLKVLGGKAKVHEAQGDFDQAYSTYLLADALTDLIRKNALLQADRSVLLQTTRSIYEGAIKLCQAKCEETAEFCEITYYFIAKNKALLLLEDIQATAALKYSAIPEIFLLEEEKLRQTVLKLEYDISNLEVEDQQLVDRLNAAKADYYALLHQLEQEYPAYFAMKYALPAPLSIAEVQGHLTEEEVLLDYFVGEQFLFVAIIRNESYEIKKWELPSSFTQLCFQFRALLDQQNNKHAAYLEIAHELYNVLLGPVLDGQSNAGKLVVIPDGLLNLIAFEALLSSPQTEWLGKTNSYLLHDFAIRYLYANYFLPPTEKAALQRTLERYAGFGLEYDDFTLQGLEKFAPEKMDSLQFKRAIGKLYYSDDEVKEASALLGGQAWVNQEATKKAFLDHGLQAQIIHFAMHGIVDERQPLNSALAFTRENKNSDFLLHAGDLYGVSLASDLGILSACQTAYDVDPRHNGGLKSLARAFTYAGCESLVASLWNASDKSSKDIVLSFLEALKSGSTKELALQEAKLNYLEDAPPAFAHPSYWANLIVIGDAQALQSTSNEWKLWAWGLLIGLLIGAVWLLIRKRK